MGERSDDRRQRAYSHSARGRGHSLLQDEHQRRDDDRRVVRVSVRSRSEQEMTRSQL